MHKIYLHKSSFGFTFELRNYNTQKTNHFEKFIKELDFKELSTQAKHPRVWILNKD